MFRSKNAALVVLVVALFSIVGCTCTRLDCPDFVITSPADGATLEPGDVKVTITALPTTWCTFGASRYEIRVDDGTPVTIQPGGDLSAVFSGVRPGKHLAKAIAYGYNGQPSRHARAVFFVPYPPPPPPPPPAPTPAPPVAPPPPPPPPKVERTPVVIEGVPDDIFFDVNKWVIKADQEATLKAWTDYLLKHPKAVVDLEGFYDERGGAAWNKTLATNRADAVKKRMLASGVYNARITTAIYAGQKFAEGSNEAAWKMNRRTHIVVTEP